MRQICPTIFIVATLCPITGCGSGTDDDSGGDNRAPVANAGDDVTVAWGRTVILHGTCDDDDDDQTLLAHAWSLLVWPAGSVLTTASLENADTADVYFEPDKSGGYTLGLTCNDGKVDGAVDLVEVTVESPPPNQNPSVDAGDDAEVALGDTVILFAAGSDPDGHPLTFAWTLESAPGASDLTTADINGADTAQASVDPDTAGDFVFRVEVADGWGGSANDSVTITVSAVQPLDGSLTVTVLDRDGLEPIPNVTVGVGASIAPGTTDATGQLTYEPAGGLTGPVNVTAKAPTTMAWDHDGDPITAAVMTPKYRLTTFTGVDRPTLTILLERTGARPTGRVTGVVPEELFNRLPDHTLEFPSIDLVGAGTFSGQVRLVLIMPVLPVGSGAELQISNLLANSPGGDVPFPGNMTTDDEFFNEYGANLGREPGPGGEPPFTVFSLPLPAGTRRLAVVGGVATLDLDQLIPLFLSGVGAGSLGDELGVVLSAIDLTTLFAGVIPVEVPAGGDVDISAMLADQELWSSAFESVTFSSVVEIKTITDPLDPGVEYELHQLRIFPDQLVTVTTGGSQADPRVAANLPANVPVEIFCGSGMAIGPCQPDPNIVDVPVPGDTSTAVPFAINVLLLTIPPGHTLAPEGGAAPVSFRFAKTPRISIPTMELGVPALDGAFSGLSFEVASVALRRLGVRESDGAFVQMPGRVTDAAAGLGIGGGSNTNTGRVLPALAEPGGGIEVTVLVDLQDLTVDPTEDPANIVLAQAMLVGLVAPVIGPDLPAALNVTASEQVGLQVMTLEAVDRAIAGGEVIPAVTPLWDILFPGSAIHLTVPALPPGFGAVLPDSAEELMVTLTGYRFRGTFSYQDPSPTTLAHRRVGLQSDNWSFRMP